MKYLILSLMLACCIPGFSNAQKQTEQARRDALMKDFKRTYTLNLEQGNKMQLDIYGYDSQIGQMNFDSLVSIMTIWLASIRDTLGSPDNVRTVTLSLYDTNAAQIETLLNRPASQRKIMYRKQLQDLKPSQDTFMLNVYHKIPTSTETHPYLKMIFSLNDIYDFFHYADRRYNDQFHDLRPANKIDWQKQGKTWALVSNPKLERLTVHDPQQKTTQMIASASLSFQNYKTRLVPSFNAGLGLQTEFFYKARQYLIGYDFNLSYEKNGGNELTMSIDRFLTFTYSVTYLVERERKRIEYETYFKAGYLMYRKSNVFNKNTWMIGPGRFYIGMGKVRVEPLFYFHGVFKNFSPALRIAAYL